MAGWQNAKPGSGKQWQTIGIEGDHPEMAAFRANEVGCPSRRARQDATKSIPETVMRESSRTSSGIRPMK
jgi:hypothetical protein